MDKNKQKFKLTIILAFIAVIIIQCGFIIYQDCKKDGYFIDEIYSYGLSNSSDKHFLNKDNMMHNKWSDKEYFSEYLSVQEGQRFNYKSVYSNQVADVHPPLYYALLHTVCSFFPNSFNKWLGESLNIIIFVVTQIFLFLLAAQVFKKNYILSFSTILLYGGTLLAINNVTYIRMYMLLAMFAVLSYYFHYKAYVENKVLNKLPILMIVTYLGCLTQYYFLILSFFIALCYCIALLYKKQIKNCLIYGTGMLVSVLAFYFTFPAVIEHLFGGRKVGNTTLENAKNIGALINNIIDYVKKAFTDIAENFAKELIIVFILIFVVAVVFCFVNKDKFKEWLKNSVADWFIIISFVLTFAVISLVAYSTYPRYLYYIYPILALLIVMFLNVCGFIVFKSRKYVALILAFAIGMSCFTYIFRDTDYLYNKVYQNKLIVSEYADCEGVVFIKNYSNAVVTQEALSLMQVKEVYCTDITNAENFDSILEGKDVSNGVVVWIDTSKVWSSGYNSKKILETISNNSDFDNSKRLYKYGLAEAYLVYK